MSNYQWISSELQVYIGQQYHDEQKLLMQENNEVNRIKITIDISIVIKHKIRRIIIVQLIVYSLNAIKTLKIKFELSKFIMHSHHISPISIHSSIFPAYLQYPTNSDSIMLPNDYILTHYLILQYIISKIRCMDLPTFIQNNLALLQQYLFAQDPQEFLKTQVALPQERKLFDFLLNAISEKEKELIKEFRLNNEDKELLFNSKLYRELERVTTEEEKQNTITRIKELNLGLHFEYPKPPEIGDKVAKSGETGQEQEKEPAPKFESQATVQAVVVKALDENAYNFQKLSNYGLKNLPLDRLAKLKENEIQFLFSKQEILRSLDPDAIAELISNMLTKMAEQKHTSEEEELPSDFFSMLSFDQLEALKKRRPKLFDSYEYHLQLFRLEYEEKLLKFKEIATLSQDQRKEKRDLCEFALLELNNSGKDFYGNLIQKLTEEILLIDQANVNSDVTLFVNYIKNLKSFNYQNLQAKFKEAKKEEYGRNKYLNKSYTALSFLQSSRVDQSTIINGTIISLFRANNNETLEALTPYLSRKFLVKEQAKVKLSLGLQKQMTNIHDLFTSDELNAIKERKEITFMPSNKKVFAANDKVELQIKLKNVKKMSKKIYTVDLEKQLLQNGSNIDDNINLKFLVPEYQEDILTKETADNFQQFKASIYFKELDGKLGQFILELQGEGMTSRAIVRKGKIIVQNRPTAVGHELSFFDGEGQSIKQLFIWRDSKRIDVKDTYLIPYGPQGSEQIIAAYNNYAEKLNIQINSEQFRFNCDYLYHSESFIVGNKAKIILHPTLNLNQRPTNLGRLQKVSITISSVNNLNISSTQVIENVIFKDNEDYVVEFPVKAYVKSIALAINGEIELINKEITKIRHSTNVAIDLEEGNENFVDIYLEKDFSGEYTLKVRGKNGQSIANAGVALSYEQFGANFSFAKDLTSDENGELNLGKLQQVVKLTIKVTQNLFTSVRTWRLNNFSQSISYGGNASSYNSYKVYLKEGDNFSLPLPCQLQLQNDIIFEKHHDTLELYYNRLSDVKLTKEKLTLQKLGVGKYALILLRFNRKIDIQVIRGKEWIGGKIINEKKLAYKLNHKPQNLLSLGDIQAAVKEDIVQYSIDVLSASQTLPSDLRVHIFAKNYIDSEIPNVFNCENRVCCPRPEVDQIDFRESAYFSNKRLSDETAYVLNRKNQDVTNGNNLQKPHIFLKRIEVRATSEKEEQLQDEGRFQNENAIFGSMAKCSMPRQMMHNMYNLCDQNLRLSAAYPSAVTLNRSLNSHNNFLHRVGHLSANLKKIQSIRVPKGYNQLSVYLISGENSIKRQYSLPEGKVQRLKLTHSALKDESKKTGWTMSREIYQVHKGEQKEISRSSTWTTVALSNVVEYAKIVNVTLPEWITSWRNYSEDKKLEVYDKELCHQLNFFIYRNDSSFFKKVVRPFINNKLRKTFIDHYLLDDEAQLLKWSRTYMLNGLNYFERAILVEKLRAFGKIKQAQNLASSLELPLKSIKKSNEQFKQFFQTVLNAKKQPTANNPLLVGGGFGGAMASGGNFDFFQAAQSSAPPGASYLMQSYQQPPMMACEFTSCAVQQCYGDMEMIAQAKQAYKPGFKETEKTKEYTQTTYSGITNPEQSSSLIPQSSFWSQLARHFASGNTGSTFLSDKFSDLNQQVEFVLACSVLSNDPQADYELANHQNGYLITAKNSFLVFVREVKSLAFEQSKNVVLNQRFFDPKNRYRFDEEGAQIEKQVQNFLIQKPYTAQTLLTNISGSNLQIQLLMDIPEGAIPLLNHEQTQIINVSLPAYNTKSFERVFYFPEEGTYSFYPANASRGKAIIAKSAQIPPLVVSRKEVVGKLQTLDNILRSGSDDDILSFISNKNIFDSNIFNFGLILWKLKDKEFFNKVIAILKERHYYDHIIWSFSIFHKDFQLVREFLNNNGPQLGQTILTLPIFEYYPYYSRRAHKFADENKSTIRVKQFRQNYAKFLFTGIFTSTTSQPHFTLTLIYYLLLQDRIADAKAVYKTIKGEEKDQFKIQYDYIDCFLDMYEGASTDYAIARKISEHYREYPVLSWRKLFVDVYNTLNKSEQEESEDSTKAEEVAFSTTVVNSGSEVKINRPAQVKVVVNVYQIDIQLYFSEFPFSELAQFSAIKPTSTITFKQPEFKVEKLERKNFAHLKNIFVEIYEQKANTALNKVSSFFWSNPDVKVKINEREGTLKVFYNGKKCPTSYCKVYSRGSKGDKFARDGYTDVASTFRYALDVKDIQEFSILVLTDHGGSIHRVKAPSIY